MKYHIITLGCPKNAVDSEGMGGILSAQGHTPTTNADEADVVIVNTCSFIAAAREETLGVLRDVAASKQAGQRLIAAGCMAESHGASVGAVPGIDAVLSTKEWTRIGELVARTRDEGRGMKDEDAPAATRSLSLDIIPLVTAPATPSQHPAQASTAQTQRSPFTVQPIIDNPTPNTQRSTLNVQRSTPNTQRSTLNVQPTTEISSLIPHPSSLPAGYADWRTTQIRRSVSGPSAYLKIGDGCNLRCAFCTIPSFKGDMRSKAVGAILAEAQELAAQGVKEIVLVAQHLTDYGRDLKLADGLATLLEELCGVLPPDVWLRLMYAYPHGISERLIATMAAHPQICRYLDMPLQHAHPETLRRMRRPPDTNRTTSILRELRAAMPDFALRSTFIVGFPGETRAEFQALLAFLEETEIDRVGVFRYSQEPGTHAATLPGQVPPHVIERRWHEVMQLQQGVSLARNRRWQGRTIPMLVEGQGAADDGRPLAVGRSFRDAPEVDGQVFMWGEAPVGGFVDVRVTQAAEYDLWGVPA
jgi:ribosomal protein S12 methylthiotransferase